MENSDTYLRRQYTFMKFVHKNVDLTGLINSKHSLGQARHDFAIHLFPTCDSAVVTSHSFRIRALN